MNQESKKLISVIMPVYNAEKFLKFSIESILNQTYKNFEFIIVNDGSKDSSLKILNEYKEKDNRIIIIDQKNMGIDGALNTALKNSKGDYIARMDADDIAIDIRLESQISYMEEKNVLFSGTWAKIIDENNNETGKLFNYPPKTWKENKKRILIHNTFIHPSVMFKRELYEKEKDKSGNLYRRYKNVEDYELWTRFVSKYKSENIQEYLLLYRIHNNQITKTNNIWMRLSGIKIRILYLFRLIFN